MRLTLLGLRRHDVPGVDALARVALGPLPVLPGVRGRAAAPLVWIALASHLRWGSKGRKVWAGNEALAGETGLPLRSVEYAIAYLKRIGRITATYRRVAIRRTRRVITMVFEAGPAPRVVLPKPDEVREIWRRVRRHRKRGAPTVALAFAAHAFASCEHRKIGRAKTCETRVGELARFVGAVRGGGFNARLAVLEAAGVLARRGLSWARGFVIHARLAVLRLVARTREAAPMLPPPVRFASVPAEERLAAMSEAFARCLYA
jgi:hypothetical protein